jgi:undecaprenyl-diphosphatase
MKNWLKKRLDPGERYGLRVTLLALAILLVAIPFGLLLREVTQQGSLTRIDTSAARNLHEEVLDHPGVVTLMQGISFLGGPPWFYLLIGISAGVLFKQGHPRLALFLIITGLVGGAIDSVVKIAVDRPRPSLVSPVATARGQSFPSGHSMTSAFGYGALLLVWLPVIAERWRRRVITGTVLLILCIGFSRLVLGVHYISDVLGGYVLGLAWLTASTAAFSIWRVERGKPKVETEEGLAPEAF